MSIYETSAALLLRLGAANLEDVGDQLLARGRTVRADVADTADYLEAVHRYRNTMGRTDFPPLDAKAIRRAIGGFRRALSTSGPNAFQQRSVATLLNVLRTQIKRVDRWVGSTWRENFVQANALLDRTDLIDLYGSPLDKVKVMSRASKVKLVRDTDPVREQAVLGERLGVEGLVSCLVKIEELIDDLRAAILAIDEAQAALTSEVREVLHRAASPDGLPLGEVTPELLETLQSARVLDDLVVRRL